MATLKIAKTYPVTQYSNVTAINFDGGQLNVYKPIKVETPQKMIVKDKCAMPKKPKLAGTVDSNTFAKLIDIVHKGFPASTKSSISEASTFICMDKKNLIYASNSFGGKWPLSFPANIIMPHAAAKLIHKVMEDYSPAPKMKVYVQDTAVFIEFRKEIALSYLMPGDYKKKIDMYGRVFNTKFTKKQNVLQLMLALEQPQGKKTVLEEMKGYSKECRVHITGSKITMYSQEPGSAGYDGYTKVSEITLKNSGSFSFVLAGESLLNAIKLTNGMKELRELHYNPNGRLVNIGKFYMVDHRIPFVKNEIIKK